ncbi:hypothetical protein JW777_07720 [bacterium]|nr:hypothetical protein [bacterium]
MRKRTLWMTLAAFWICGCSQMAFVPYERVEKTNRLSVRLDSGQKVEGTVIKADPVQIILSRPDGGSVAVPRDRIASIRRKPPVSDEFGRGISEEEISSVQTGRKAAVYGVGGGTLSLGFSFFAGSLLGHSSANGGAILAATAALGSGIGTAFFLKAGRQKDRLAAIETIRLRRRNAGTRPDSSAADPEELRTRIEEERRMREEARRQREELLREIESGGRNTPDR